MEAIGTPAPMPTPVIARAMYKWWRLVAPHINNQPPIWGIGNKKRMTISCKRDMQSRQTPALAAEGRIGVNCEWTMFHHTMDTIPGIPMVWQRECLTRGMQSKWMSYQGYAVKADGCTSAKPGCKAHTLVNITLGRWSYQGSKLTLCQLYARFGEPLNILGFLYTEHWIILISLSEDSTHLLSRVHTVLKI